MSEQRIPDFSFTRKIARENGKIKKGFVGCIRFEFFRADQFKKRIDGVNYCKQIPAARGKRKEFYEKNYRVRINGKWYMPQGKKYYFVTLQDGLKLLIK